MSMGKLIEANFKDLFMESINQRSKELDQKFHLNGNPFFGGSLVDPEKPPM